MVVNISILWKEAVENCGVSVEHGLLSGESRSERRLDVTVDAKNLGLGASPTMVRVRWDGGAFAFFARDVSSDFPILVPAYGVAVVPVEDSRSYEDVETAVKSKGLLTNLQHIDAEPEESFEEAAGIVRELHHPIWMGIGRDVRIFEVGLRAPMIYTDWIQPRFHGNGYFWADYDKYTSPRYGFVAGRGWECNDDVRRWLDDDALPILHFARTDGDIRYDHTLFCTLEKSPLIDANVRGTHYLVADGVSQCHVFDEEQSAKFDLIADDELIRDEETVVCCHVIATNTAQVPRYAFFKAPYPHQFAGDPAPYDFDPETGFGLKKDTDLVFAVSKLNGVPVRQEEIAVLLKPGEIATFEFILPHMPIPRDRAEALMAVDIPSSLEECRRFWHNKLDAAGSLRVPEKRVDSMLRAGHLHLDLTAYGIEPDQPVAMTDGAYVPVITEIWVNTNYLDSIGLHSLVRRCLAYYLEKQHENGMMQTFTQYMGETGAALLAFGEHYRYTHDDDWVREIAPKLIKSCEFIVDCRAKNMTEDLRGRGYGMLQGQFADPPDGERRIYVLNAFAYSGIRSAAQMLANVCPEDSAKLKLEADSFREDIRASLFESLANGPVMPTGDGTWCPTTSPWAASSGPECLYAEGRKSWTHGSMTIRDDCAGVNHLIAQGVIDPTELAAEFILSHQNELMFSRNLPSSQPYYSRHPIFHLQRGEPKRFMKAFYNCFASLADREIYSFWEHYYHESAHKTHEEAQFLMQARCMLYIENGDTLSLMAGVPRVWLEDGKKIELQNVVSYFGKLSASVVSRVNGGVIEAEITCDSDRKPKNVEIRLPHPSGAKATKVVGGDYDPHRESVYIADFKGNAKIQVTF